MKAKYIHKKKKIISNPNISPKACQLDRRAIAL